MDIQAIIRELTQTERLPREALAAASARRAEMVPVFLKEIEDHPSLDPAARTKPTPLFFIFHLLGEWREKSAYRPLARLLRLPDDEVDAIFGDSITTTSHRVMAALFDGDPQPLYEIILDPNAEEFVRWSMWEALAMVTRRGNSIARRPADFCVTPSWSYSRRRPAMFGLVGKARSPCLACAI